MIHPFRNKVVRWLYIRYKRLDYGKHYKEHWEERGGRLRNAHENSDVSEKYAEQTARYIVSQVKPQDTILEYGCGFGRNLKVLERALASDCKIYGIDLSSAALEEGKRYLSGRAVLKQTDGLKIPFSDDFFGLSFTSAVLEHVPEKDFKKICDEIIRVTKKTIIHIEANRNYYTKYPHDYKKFYESKGHKVKIFKMPDYDEVFDWYVVTLVK
jgi:ubiquinone/menaquinone biosynthesis C-methylase UbiE